MPPPSPTVDEINRDFCSEDRVLFLDNLRKSGDQIRICHGEAYCEKGLLRLDEDDLDEDALVDYVDVGEDDEAAISHDCGECRMCEVVTGRDRRLSEVILREMVLKRTTGRH